MTLTRLDDEAALREFNWVERRLKTNDVDPKKLRTWARKVPVVLRRNGIVAALLIAQREPEAGLIMAELASAAGFRGDLSGQLQAAGALAEKDPLGYLRAQVTMTEHALWVKRAAEALIADDKGNADVENGEDNG